jgi:transposase-like protein
MANEIIPTDEQVETIKAMVNSGKSSTAIAHVLGIPKPRVQKWRRALGISAKAGRPKVVREEAAQN